MGDHTIHASAGRGVTFCGLLIQRRKVSADENEVTCPACLAALKPQEKKNV